MVSQLGRATSSFSSFPVVEVKKATLRATPRLVKGCLIAAAAAKAVVMPGMISYSIPAFSNAVSSSSARPNSMGSPPLSLTTRAYLNAQVTSF